MKNHPKSAEIQDDGCRALCTFAISGVYEQKIVGTGGIDFVLAVLNNHLQSASIQDKACTVLSHLVVNVTNKQMIVAAGGIDLICATMQKHATII